MQQETHHEMRIPERDVTYIVLSVYIWLAMELFSGTLENDRAVLSRLV